MIRILNKHSLLFCVHNDTVTFITKKLPCGLFRPTTLKFVSKENKNLVSKKFLTRNSRKSFEASARVEQSSARPFHSRQGINFFSKNDSPHMIRTESFEDIFRAIFKNSHSRRINARVQSTDSLTDCITVNSPTYVNRVGHNPSLQSRRL